MRVEQKADGTYQKVLTTTEIALMRNLSIEAKQRGTYDAELLTLIQRLTLEVESLKNLNRGFVVEMQNLSKRIQALEVK